MTKVREENNAGGRGRKYSGRPEGGSGTDSPSRDPGAGKADELCGNSAPGIRSSMCKGPEGRVHWVCLRRRRAWPGPGGQGETAASGQRHGRARSDSASCWDSKGQSWGPKERPPPSARTHSFTHHSFDVSFIVIIHSFTSIIHSFAITCHSFIILYSRTRCFVNPDSATCPGDESDPSLPTLKGPQFWGGGTDKKTH